MLTRESSKGFGVFKPSSPKLITMLTFALGGLASKQGFAEAKHNASAGSGRVGAASSPSSFCRSRAA